jgi:hypothetical protein
VNDFEHVAEIETDCVEYRAACSCGWTGEWRPDDLAATDDAEDHREVVTDRLDGPPVGFDRFMSGLLDLQDDLAAAAMWLAEHWSADLPVPGWYTSGREAGAGPAFLVLAYCVPDDLARAAELLGAEVVEDPCPDVNGNRYRRAQRAFGRVLIEGYTSAQTECRGCWQRFDGEACPNCGQRADATGAVELSSYGIVAAAS